MSAAQVGRQTVFKISNGKLAATSNGAESCAHCCAVRTKRNMPFPVCGGCRLKRYCCREHQAADWLTHKEFCTLRAAGRLGCAESPEQLQLHRLSQDWSELFLLPCTWGATNMLRACGGAFDYRAQHVVLDLQDRRDYGKNPARAFRVADVRVQDNAALDERLRSKVENFLAVLDTGHTALGEYTRRDKVARIVPWLYMVDGVPTLMSHTIVCYDPRSKSQTHTGDTWEALRASAKLGSVFRLAGRGESVRGSLVQNGRKFIWHEIPPAQLEEERKIAVRHLVLQRLATLGAT